MKVIFGRYIEVIIDPQMEMVGQLGLYSHCTKASYFDVSAAPNLPAMGDQGCVSGALHTHTRFSGGPWFSNSDPL